MAKYPCPLCGSEVHEELRTVHEDAERWIIDRIKRQHPEWVSADGACARCVEAFKARPWAVDSLWGNGTEREGAGKCHARRPNEENLPPALSDACF